MGKSGKTNPKAEAARARRASVAAEKEAAEQKALEDAAWVDNRKKKKHELKKEAKDSEHDAKLARKAELKKLQAEEDAELGQLKKGGGKRGPVPKKTTKYELAQQQAARDAAADVSRLVAQQKAANITSEAAYAAQLDAGNTNRSGGSILAASGIDDAVAVLSGTPSGGRAASREASAGSAVGGEPSEVVLARVAGESGGRVSFKVFEKVRLPEMKEERPGLKASQYRDHIRKEWQRSRYNSHNQ